MVRSQRDEEGPRPWSWSRLCSFGDALQHPPWVSISQVISPQPPRGRGRQPWRDDPQGLGLVRAPWTIAQCSRHFPAGVSAIGHTVPGSSDFREGSVSAMQGLQVPPACPNARFADYLSPRAGRRWRRPSRRGNRQRPLVADGAISSPRRFRRNVCRRPPGRARSIFCGRPASRKRFAGANFGLSSGQTNAWRSANRLPVGIGEGPLACSDRLRHSFFKKRGERTNRLFGRRRGSVDARARAPESNPLGPHSGDGLVIDAAQQAVGRSAHCDRYSWNSPLCSLQGSFGRCFFFGPCRGAYRVKTDTL